MGKTKAETGYSKAELRYARELALKILSFTREHLIVNMPYFDRAVMKMPVVFYRNGFQKRRIRGFGTNGRRIICNPFEVISLFRENSAQLPRIYLHMLLHCVFHHPFRYGALSSDDWDLAADLAAENVILELNREDVRIDGDRERIGILQDLRTSAGRLTAENLYHYFYVNPAEAEKYREKAALFHRDEHRFWLPEEFTDSQEASTRDDSARFDQTESEWARLAKSLRMDLDAYEKNQGMVPDVLRENIRASIRGRRDYRSFLRKFMTEREEMRVDPDTFDQVYYSYGLSLYGNMPLIEPLEYREDRKIHDLAIVIDTSGSTQGRTVRGFLRETYTILREREAFSGRMRVHIIQADAKVQKDVCLTSEEMFERYMENIELSGGGGTDFRPAFRYVDELLEKGTMEDLNGLLYFTDGLGTFPERMPPYKTAFLLLKGREKLPDVPSWAVTMELAEEDFAAAEQTAETIEQREIHFEY